MQVTEFERQSRWAYEGNHPAMLQLAKMYYFGNNGVTKDFTAAKYWLEKVILERPEGTAIPSDAHTMYGYLYAAGEGGMCKDFGKALLHYNIARRRRYQDGSFLEGRLWELGQYKGDYEQTPNYFKATECFRAAEWQGREGMKPMIERCENLALQSHQNEHTYKNTDTFEVYLENLKMIVHDGLPLELDEYDLLCEKISLVSSITDLSLKNLFQHCYEEFDPEKLMLALLNSPSLRSLDLTGSYRLFGGSKSHLISDSMKKFCQYLPEFKYLIKLNLTDSCYPYEEMWDDKILQTLYETVRQCPSISVIIFDDQVSSHWKRQFSTLLAQDRHPRPPLIQPSMSPRSTRQVEDQAAQRYANFNSTASLNSNQITGQIKKHEIDFQHDLGRGAFGVVKFGMWCSKQVAVKQLLNDANTLSADELEKFKAEAEVLQQLDHENVVKMFGICEDSLSLLIVMEFVKLGTLHSHLHNTHFSLDDGLRMRFCLNVASGMQYVHAKNILHLDLKPLNLLVTASWIVKISDFGLARVLVSRTHSSTANNTGTLAYMDPALFKKDSSGKVKYRKANDIHSFGVVINEIWSRKSPYSGLLPMVAMAQILQGMPPDIAQNTPSLLKELINECFGEIDQRPTFDHLEHRLQEICLSEKFRTFDLPANT